MHGLKRIFGALTATAAIACLPIMPAAAGVHGYGHFHPWGLGHGLVGAVVGLATLPLAIAAAAIGADQGPAPYPAPGYATPGYAPPPAYYAAPRPYYAAPPAYYARPAAYYPAPHAYYAPRPYYAARPTYNYGYGGPGAYRGGYAYPHR
jgi:hypothetical protein